MEVMVGHFLSLMMECPWRRFAVHGRLRPLWQAARSDAPRFVAASGQSRQMERFAESLTIRYLHFHTAHR
jgi:hypothetical protein